MTTAVERSSSHIRTQWEILSREYQRHNAVSPPLSEDAVADEEQEYEAADYIVTPSEFAYQSFLDRGFDERSVKCIPFGVDPPPTTSCSRDSETVRFLFAGNVSIRKGIPYLLEAWDKVDLPDAELAIASEVEKDLRPLISDYEERNDVRLLGWVDDLEDCFNRSSVFVFPSLEEGSAIVTYEAMAAGLPLITTYNSGWVGEDGVHGIEVPAADSGSLANALRKLYDDASERRRMGKEAETLIRENYTLDDYGERVHQAYRSMIDSN
ncbi:glycosyltransferase family 4 protein [Halopenitus persicus]|uniref:Glycosyl transferases group 1 n=1 Tax=Halopenitus persicus TaxID=1048396 RepID=A0A1H3IYS3_9EURY|nr:glycosyltransferase family 4 protein [Halopenitus persicus]SDY32870.1 Glycosyl transferases group 1 [Halopenitus persicus]